MYSTESRNTPAIRAYLRRRDGAGERVEEQLAGPQGLQGLGAEGVEGVGARDQVLLQVAGGHLIDYGVVFGV